MIHQLLKMQKMNSEYLNTNWKSIVVKTILFCILISSFVLVLRNLGHSKTHYWDESYHAIVARNLTKHPLKFTLYDQPWLQYDYTKWGENHIWLHKPPVAMWQICLSHFIFGINTFALRLPSAISLVLCAWLTFKIASNLFDERAGLIAAFFQAFNPFLFASVHGYRYSDHIDIALLLWVQVSCWFLLLGIRSGKRRNYILSGIAMGIAYLSKSYLALITFGVAFSVWFVAWFKQKIYYNFFAKDNIDTDKVQRDDTEHTEISLRDVGIILLAGVATVAPWTIYCLIRHTKEFLWEHKRVIDHLNTNVEGWGASWDRPLFEYMPLFYPWIYAALFAVVLCLLVMLIKNWRLPELFVLAWGIGVIVPHTFATTKTPSATMISVPPLLICLGAVISRAWQRKDWIYTAIWCSSMLAITSITAIASKTQLFAHIRDIFSLDWIRGFAPYIHKHFVIVEQLIVFGIFLAIFWGIYLLIRKTEWQKWLWMGVRLLAIGIACFYVGRYVGATYKVIERNAQTPLYVQSGIRIQHDLPENACFFTDDQRSGAHFDLMYHADRSTYRIVPNEPNAMVKILQKANEAREAGAIPYVFSITQTEYNFPLIIEDEVDIGDGNKQRYRIYEITESE